MLSQHGKPVVTARSPRCAPNENTNQSTAKGKARTEAPSWLGGYSMLPPHVRLLWPGAALRALQQYDCLRRVRSLAHGRIMVPLANATKEPLCLTPATP